MGRKNKLLSIGEVSNFTGASIKSLRYYEKLQILKPTFVDPYSGYRYYSFDQTHVVYVIRLCIELDIPLKDLARYIGKNQTLELSALLAHGREITKKKIQTLQAGLRFIEAIEQKIAVTEKYQQYQQIYTQEIPEKSIWPIPLPQGTSFEDDMDLFEISRPFWNSEYDDEDSYELLEYGNLCEYSPSGVKRYIFIELPRHKTNNNTRIIPGGTYFCKQSETTLIEQAPQIFAEQLNGAASFLAIETEAFTGRSKINNPLSELRVITISNRHP